MQRDCAVLVIIENIMQIIARTFLGKIVARFAEVIKCITERGKAVSGVLIVIELFKRLRFSTAVLDFWGKTLSIIRYFIPIEDTAAFTVNALG